MSGRIYCVQYGATHCNCQKNFFNIFQVPPLILFLFVSLSTTMTRSSDPVCASANAPMPPANGLSTNWSEGGLNHSHSWRSPSEWYFRQRRVHRRRWWVQWSQQMSSGRSPRVFHRLLRHQGPCYCLTPTQSPRTGKDSHSRRGWRTDHKCRRRWHGRPIGRPNHNQARWSSQRRLIIFAVWSGGIYTNEAATLVCRVSTEHMYCCRRWRDGDDLTQSWRIFHSHGSRHWQPRRCTDNCATTFRQLLTVYAYDGLIVATGRLIDAVPGRVDVTARCWSTQAAVDDEGAVASSTLFLSDQRLCDVLLLASSAQMCSTFTRCVVCSYAGPRFCDVTRWLLQRHSHWGIQDAINLSSWPDDMTTVVDYYA